MVMHTQASYAIAHEITARFWQDVHLRDSALDQWTRHGWAKAAWGCIFGQCVSAARFSSTIAPLRGQVHPGSSEKAGITTFCAPPTIYRILVQEPLGDY